MCALVTAGLLVACGIVALVFTMMNLELPVTLVNDACTKTAAGVVRLASAEAQPNESLFLFRAVRLMTFKSCPCPRRAHT